MNLKKIENITVKKKETMKNFEKNLIILRNIKRCQRELKGTCEIFTYLRI